MFIENGQRRLLEEFGNTENETMRAQVDMLKRVYMNLTYKEFNSTQEINDYISDPGYMTSEDKPGICFGFSIVENNPIDYEVRLMFNDQRFENGGLMIPYQNNPVVSKFKPEFDNTSYALYTR